MKIKLKNVKVYNRELQRFEPSEVCVENGVFVDAKNLEEDELWDCSNDILIPNFVSDFGNVEKELEKDMSDPTEIARRLVECYLENGYSKIVEQIDNLEVAQKLGDFWIETEVVSGDLKLLSKVKQKGKRNLSIGVWVDLVCDSPNEIDEKVMFAHKNGLKIYSNFYESLNRAGEISIQYSKSPIEAARDFGMLDEHLVSINNVCLDKEDIVQMENVKLCLAPKTNMFSGLGFEPVGLIKNHEKDVGFASFCEFGLDVFDNMRLALCEARASMNDEDILSEKNVLSWATGTNEFSPQINKIASFLLVKSKKTHKNIENIEDFVKFLNKDDIAANVIAGRVVFKK